SGALKQTTSGSAAGRRKRGFLIAAQVAACLMLLAGAGLLFPGVWGSRAVDPGVDIHHMQLGGSAPHPVAATPAAQTQLIKTVVERVGALPGVQSVAWADRPPFLAHGTGDFQNERGAITNCLFNFVSASYFDTVGIPLLAGRGFSQQEVE